MRSLQVAWILLLVCAIRSFSGSALGTGVVARMDLDTDWTTNRFIGEMFYKRTNTIGVCWDVGASNLTVQGSTEVVSIWVDAEPALVYHELTVANSVTSCVITQRKAGHFVIAVRHFEPQGVSTGYSDWCYSTATNRTDALYPWWIYWRMPPPSDVIITDHGPGSGDG